MTKKEFFSLLEKYENGACSAQEVSLLFQFSREAQQKDFKSSWSVTEEEQARVRLLKRIMDTIETDDATSTDRKTHLFWRIAAICIILVGVGFLYWQITNQPVSVQIPTHSITLELEDGTLKVLDEHGGTTVRDKKGNIIGQQTGTQIRYQKTDPAEVLAYNTLTVPYGRRFQVELSDGTKAHVNAGSSLRYPVQFLKGSDRNVFLSGEAFFEVSKDTNRPFIVNADQLDIEVLGTKFNVHVYQEDQLSEVVLVEGSVALSANKIGSSPVLLKPGQKGSFNKSSAEIATSSVVTDIYTSWMQGKLVFRNMPFENILRKLERHYNVTIVNTNANLGSERFNASFEPVQINKVFESLEKYHGIHYTIIKDTIYVE